MTKRYVTPLRYPGGKAKISPIIKDIIIENNIFDGDYLEPYAGGAGVAFSLLFNEFMRSIHINDISKPIFSFWHSVLYETNELISLIQNTKVNMDTWYLQKQIQQNPNDQSSISLGFSTFFLNRTNRSGILRGGVIGGKNQNGKWKIDARFNKNALVGRIKRIAEYKSRIQLSNLDAVEFLKFKLKNTTKNILLYLDPPYYNKAERLYENHYSHEDHLQIRSYLANLHNKWVVTYDNTPEIRQIYSGFRMQTYDLSYSAQAKYKGAEVMIFSNNLHLPQFRWHN